MSQQLYTLVGPRFEPQNSRSRDERVSARPTSRYKPKDIAHSYCNTFDLSYFQNILEKYSQQAKIFLLPSSQANSGITCRVDGLVKMALHPPQKSLVHRAFGNLGHLAVRHGGAKQLTVPNPGGQT